MIVYMLIATVMNDYQELLSSFVAQKNDNLESLRFL